MQFTSHPDDELLAAYAGSDADAIADEALREHVTSCDRCRPMVDELAALRTALGDLPDLKPPRPLRLIPPVAELPAGRTRPLAWLRRLAAPAMAAGAGLVLVGAVGASGLVTLPFASSASLTSKEGGAAGEPVPAAATDNADYSRSASPRVDNSGAAPSPTPQGVFGALSPRSVAERVTEQPWLTLLVAGLILVAVSLILRYSLNPRAG